MRLIDADVLWMDIIHAMDYCDDILDIIESQPTVESAQLIRCKDCKYFELDHWEKVNGVPLIVAHEICMLWGGGCKTGADGFCSYARRKEEEQK